MSDRNDLRQHPKIIEAMRVLPLPELMKQLELGPYVNTHANVQCPLCHREGTFALRENSDSTWFFECSVCGSGDKIMFLRRYLKLGNLEGAGRYLEMAGVIDGPKPKQPLTGGPQSGNGATNGKTVESPANPAVKPRPLGKLLDAITGILRRYVVFPLQEQVTVIAIWIVHTWVFKAFDYTAYLFIFSAAKRSGKSRVLEVIEQLARHPVKTEGPSSASLIRSISESHPPTLLIDEVDTIYGGKGDGEAENTRRFLNAGYRRGAKFLRCVGQGADIHVKEFPAFCPKALAGIDRCLPDTVLDRSVPIELVRQSRQERAERFREREVRAVVAPLRAELQALAQQPSVTDALRDARPGLPEELNDRVQDITEPLIAIADLAGGEWPGWIRSAVVKLYSGEEEVDIGVKLLMDIQRVFDGKHAEKLPTKDLLEALIAIEDGPWALLFEDALRPDRVKAAAAKLARHLKRYKIKPCKIRFGEETAQGYQKADFKEAWERYLPTSAPISLKVGTNGTDGTEPDSASENDVPTSVPSTRNMFHKERTPNVPSVPSVPSNLEEEGDVEI